MSNSAHDAVINRYYIIVVVLMAFMLATMFDNAHATGAPSLTCKSSAGAHGIAESKSIAKIRAKDHWSKLTEAVYGTDWASFSNAQDTSFKCQQTATLWGCAVNARPCKEEAGHAQTDNGDTVKTASQTAQRAR